MVTQQQNLFNQGDWGQLKADMSFDEYVSCDSGIVDWDINLRTNDGWKIYIWCAWGGR